MPLRSDLKSASPHTIVVGGGLGGLAAALGLARTGAKVRLFERASALGGRAQTTKEQGFSMNFGPHAIYSGGAAESSLAELGIPIDGEPPRVAGALMQTSSGYTSLPVGFWSLAKCNALSVGGRFEGAKWLASFARMDTRPLMGISFRAWCEANVRDPGVRAILEMFARLSTYTNAPERLSAGVAIRQIVMGSKGVRYVHGGWGSLVAKLEHAAIEAGVVITRGERVERVVSSPEGSEASGVKGVMLASGEFIAADAVVLAVPPGVARSLTPQSAALASWDRELVPVRAACLDIALRTFSKEAPRFMLGLDAPLYYSVHSDVARLAPEGSAVVHVAKYLEPGAPVDAADEALFEKVLDDLVPGWRDQVVARRFLPSITVTHALVTASSSGVRPGPLVPDVPGLFVVGDWVGGEGMLVDASLGSAGAVVGLASARAVAEGSRAA